MIAKIAALYAERLMSDITLVINGQEFYAHRLILCASSDVFQASIFKYNLCVCISLAIILHICISNQKTICYIYLIDNADES